MDYSKNQSYFSRDFSIAGFIAGLAVLAVGLALLTRTGLTLYQNKNVNFSEVRFFILIPLVFFVTPGALAVIFNIPHRTISDFEYDASVEGYAFTLRQRALDALGIDKSEVKEAVPVILVGYDFEGADRVKQGGDGKWRSSICKVITMFFSRDKLYSYTMTFLTTKTGENEETNVFPYKDIVSVSSELMFQRAMVRERDIIIIAEAFKLAARGGTSLLTVNVLDSHYAREAVGTIRALIRRKNQA